MLSFKSVLSVLTGVIIIFSLVTLTSAESTDLSDHKSHYYKYQNLFKSLNLPDRSTNFLAFSDFEVDQDKADHSASLDYLSSRPDLINQIRDDLGSKEIHWQLEEISSRILYVPESRREVAGLFTDYCRDTIEDLLTRTGLINPYSSISIMNENAVITPVEGGISAVIVQDLAKEYVARYQFSGKGEKRIEIGLSGRTTINEVGSYSSFIQFSEEIGEWQFFRNQQTVWKSVSTNPYTVLMTPLEETLHIALREHTEKAILATVKAQPATLSTKDIQDVVEEWLAIEEAIVGGLVYSLIPDIVIRRIPDLPKEWIQADLDTKAQFPKYRFLRKAIKMVEDYGLKKSINTYAQDPVATRILLSKAS